VIAIALLAVRSAGFAQGVVIHSDRFASSGGQSFKNVVRSADGTLYCVSILETEEGNREVIAQASADGGGSWDQGSFTFNDAGSGLTAPELSNGCAVAIDDRGALHVVWGSYSYPSSYHQFYRNWDPASGAASEIFDISTWTGAPRTTRTAAMDIAVDRDNTVWIVAHGPQSWVERLAHSAAPCAEGMEFVDVGTISPSASAQTTRIAIDPSGRVHCTFYRNIGAGQYEHRIYDPASGWGESTNLGNATPQNDVWGVLAIDGLGNAHVLFGEDSADASPLWRFLYRRWDEVAGWGEPVALLEVEPAARTGIADTHIIALACDESTGDVTVLYRDLNRGGPLGIVRKSLDDVGFGEFAEIAPPTTGQNAYCSPSIRGRLFPESDRTSHGLHMTWQHRPEPGVPPYSLVFAALDGAGPPRFRRADTDASAIVNITDPIVGLEALFIGGSPPTCMDAADSNDDGRFDLSDAVYTLSALFLGGDPPPSPGVQDCGDDPTDDDLGCERYGSC
jgi:hypothetical protein